MTSTPLLWGTSEVSRWLIIEGLDMYAGVFLRVGVMGVMLPALAEESDRGTDVLTKQFGMSYDHISMFRNATKRLFRSERPPDRSLSPPTIAVKQGEASIPKTSASTQSSALIPEDKRQYISKLAKLSGDVPVNTPVTATVLYANDEHLGHASGDILSAIKTFSSPRPPPPAVDIYRQQNMSIDENRPLIPSVTVPVSHQPQTIASAVVFNADESLLPISQRRLLELSMSIPSNVTFLPKNNNLRMRILLFGSMLFVSIGVSAAVAGHRFTKALEDGFVWELASIIWLILFIVAIFVGVFALFKFVMTVYLRYLESQDVLSVIREGNRLVVDFMDDDDHKRSIRIDSMDLPEDSIEKIRSWGLTYDRAPTLDDDEYSRRCSTMEDDQSTGVSSGFVPHYQPRRRTRSEDADV